MRALLILVFALFGLYSGYVMWEVGYFGIWQAGFASLGSAQILADLFIMAWLLLGYLWHDARATGRRFWPYALITLAAGSFGPLLYLLLAPRRTPAQRLSAVAPG